MLTGQEPRVKRPDLQQFYVNERLFDILGFTPAVALVTSGSNCANI